MSPLNNQEKINILKVLFNNSRDTLSLKDKDNIRYSINKYIDIYNLYINKTKLNKVQQSKLDDTINILNEIYNYLSNRSVPNTHLSYSPSKTFTINDNYAINRIYSIKTLFDKKRDSLSNDQIKDITKEIYENVKHCDAYKAKKIASKRQRATFNDIKDSLDKLYDYILNIETENYDDEDDDDDNIT